MNNPVHWFEIPVTDMDRAQKFYETVLDQKLDVRDFGNFVMAWFSSNPTQPGSGGTLIKAESYVPSHEGSLIYFGVAEINDVLPRVEPAGGKVLNPKTSIGEYGHVAHFEDTEGNRVAFHQPPAGM